MFEIIDSTIVDGNPVIMMRLTDSDYSRSMWMHEFEYVYTVELCERSLNTRVEVRNTGSDAFEFTGALHSYFAATNISTVRVNGLRGLRFLDKVADPMNPTEKVSDAESLSIESAVDSVFLDAPSLLSIETGHSTQLELESASGWKDAVVWSPWTAMENCYKEFVCVENAMVRPSSLAPGDSFVAEMSIRA